MMKYLRKGVMASTEAEVKQLKLIEVEFIHHRRNYENQATINHDEASQIQARGRNSKISKASASSSMTAK